MFPNTLKKMREQLKLNKRQMANFLQIPYTTYNNYEIGSREPNTEMMIRLASKLDVSVDYLLGVEELNNRLEKIDKTTQKAVEIGKSMKATLLHAEELDAKEYTCGIINKLDYDNTMKAKDYVSVLYENMTFHDEKQITIDEVQADEGDKK